MAVPLAGAKVLASDLSTIFPTNTDAWTSYTPTLVQSGAVTKTVSRGVYMKIGRVVFAEMVLAVTGAGTANNEIRIGLPVAASGATSVTVGQGYVLDVSAGPAFYKGFASLDNTLYVTLLDTSVNTAAKVGGAGSAMTAALANGDYVVVAVKYESAS